MKPVRMIYITEAECERLTKLLCAELTGTHPEDGALLNKLHSAKERFAIATPQENGQ